MRASTLRRNVGVATQATTAATDIEKLLKVFQNSVTTGVTAWFSSVRRVPFLTPGYFPLVDCCGNPARTHNGPDTNTTPLVCSHKHGRLLKPSVRLCGLTPFAISTDR